MTISKNGKTHKYLSSFADRKRSTEPRTESVPIPEWSDDPEDPIYITVRGIYGAERREFLAMGWIDDPANVGQRIRNARWFDTGHRDVDLLRRCCRQENGAQFLTESDAREIVDDQDQGPYLRLLGAAERASILDDETFRSVRQGFLPMSSSSSSTPSPKPSNNPSPS